MFDNPLSNIENGDIFKPSVIDAWRFITKIKEMNKYIGDILNVNFVTCLISAENGDPSVGQCLHREHVDGKIEAHPRRVAAYSGRSDTLDGDAVLITQQDAFTDHFRFVVIGYRHQKKDGFLFRAGFTPFYRVNGVFFPLIGLSFGYSW